MNEVINMACQECKRKNYATTKNKKTHREKLQLKKYCKFCKKHTLHKESK
jgi:large subunit ribosomal protein L33